MKMEPFEEEVSEVFKLQEGEQADENVQLDLELREIQHEEGI